MLAVLPSRVAMATARVPHDRGPAGPALGAGVASALRVPLEVRSAHVWTGRRGPVLLGPAEHRVAVFLEHATRRGRVTLRQADINDRLHLERSEGYRITRRLRVLGLFGVENDRSGSTGGRRWWRTSSPHDGAGLEPGRHHEAWSRITGWARATDARLAALLADLRITHGAGLGQARVQLPPAHPLEPAGAFPNLRAAMLELAPTLAAEWRLGT